MLELLLHTSSNKTKTMDFYSQIYQCFNTMSEQITPCFTVKMLLIMVTILHIIFSSS